jgi:hypothetical protein
VPRPPLHRSARAAPSPPDPAPERWSRPARCPPSRSPPRTLPALTQPERQSCLARRLVLRPTHRRSTRLTSPAAAPPRLASRRCPSDARLAPLRRLARRHPASAGASPHAAAASACRREPMPPPASYRVDGATLGREMELMRLWKEIRKGRKK